MRGLGAVILVSVFMMSNGGDAIFGCVERLHATYIMNNMAAASMGKAQAPQSWGSVLDAGTGSHSLQWICQLPTEKWTAVTASEQMAAEVRRARGVRQRPQDEIVIGNWEDESFLGSEQFDVIIADYLIGAGTLKHRKMQHRI